MTPWPHSRVLLLKPPNTLGGKETSSSIVLTGNAKFGKVMELAQSDMASGWCGQDTNTNSAQSALDTYTLPGSRMLNPELLTGWQCESLIFIPPGLAGLPLAGCLINDC